MKRNYFFRDVFIVQVDIAMTIKLYCAALLFRLWRGSGSMAGLFMLFDSNF